MDDNYVIFGLIMLIYGNYEINIWVDYVNIWNVMIIMKLIFRIYDNYEINIWVDYVNI